jgi:hypothetical protein
LFQKQNKTEKSVWKHGFHGKHARTHLGGH